MYLQERNLCHWLADFEKLFYLLPDWYTVCGFRCCTKKVHSNEQQYAYIITYA